MKKFLIVSGILIAVDIVYAMGATAGYTYARIWGPIEEDLNKKVSIKEVLESEDKESE